MLLKDCYNEHDEIDKTKTDENDVLKSMKIGSLFQIMFYNLHSGNKRTPLHVMKVVEINERCKSTELITSFNRRGFCISYATMIVTTLPSLLLLIHLSLICQFRVTFHQAHL